MSNNLKHLYTKRVHQQFSACMLQQASAGSGARVKALDAECGRRLLSAVIFPGSRVHGIKPQPLASQGHGRADVSHRCSDLAAQVMVAFYGGVSVGLGTFSHAKGPCSCGPVCHYYCASR
jgi:hypothetical protein